MGLIARQVNMDLLEQPLAALAGPGYDKPVWHCAIRARDDPGHLRALPMPDTLPTPCWITAPG